MFVTSFGDTISDVTSTSDIISGYIAEDPRRGNVQRMRRVEAGRARFRGWREGCAVAALLGALAGCANLPDAQPLAESTARLAGANRSVGAAAVTQVRVAADYVLPENRARVLDQANTLEHAWTAHAAALDAAAAYARSLKEVADAGNSGAESVRKIADSAKTLADSVKAVANIAIPFGGEAASLATDALAFAYGEIAKARARHTLKAALTELQPAVDKLCEIMQASLTDLEAIAQVTTALQLNGAKANLSDELNYRARLIGWRDGLYAGAPAAMSSAELERLGTLDEIIRQRQAELEELRASNIGDESTERVPELETEIGNHQRDFAALARRMEAFDIWQAKLAGVEALLGECDKWYLPYVEFQREAAERGDVIVGSTRACKRGVDEFGRSHRDYAKAVQESGRIDSARLVDSVVEIHGLVERLRELRRPASPVTE